MIFGVRNAVVAPVLDQRAICFSEVVHLLRVRLGVPKRRNRLVVADHGLVVHTPRQALRHCEGPAGVIHRRLVNEDWKVLLARVTALARGRAASPADPHDVRRPDSPRETKAVVLGHDPVLFGSLGETDVLAEYVLGEAVCELVEGRLGGRLGHEGHPADVVEAVHAPSQNVERCQHLRGDTYDRRMLFFHFKPLSYTYLRIDIQNIPVPVLICAASYEWRNTRSGGHKTAR